LYTIWIGTNDVGAGELLTGQAAPGVNIVDVSKCAVDVVHTLYKSGARKFLFQNVSYHALVVTAMSQLLNMDL
jgi:hypothetical protein